MDICRATEVSETQLKSLHKKPMVAVAALTVSKKRMSEKPKKLRSIVKACNKEAEPKFFYKPNFVQQI